MSGVLINNSRDGINLEASREFVITPNDDAELPQHATSFYVTGAGNIHYETVGGDDITKTVVANSYHPIQIRKVFITGTTATGIIAQY